MRRARIRAETLRVHKAGEGRVAVPIEVRVGEVFLMGLILGADWGTRPMGRAGRWMAGRAETWTAALAGDRMTALLPLVDAFQMGMRSSQYSRGGAGGSALNLGSLLQMGSRLSEDAGRGQSGAVGTALGVMPKMSQAMNEGLRVPIGDSNGKLQFGYRDQIGQGGNGIGGEIGRGSAQAAYQTGLKHDLMRFSATATYGAGGGFGSGGFGSGGQGATSFGGGAGGSMGAGIGSGSGASGMFGGGTSGGMGGGEGHSGGMSMGDAGGTHGGFGGQGGPGGGHGKGGGAATTPAVSLKLSF